MANKKSLRPYIQALGALAFNSRLDGFVTGMIQQGQLKTVCVPVLNCYSCPAAVGSCPIGSMQAIIDSRKFNFSFYVLGLMLLFGIMLGRFFCGFLCPFGFIQDLLYKIPTPKIAVPKLINSIFSKLKYFVLAVFVIILPMLLIDKYGLSDPFFCKWLCPAGIVEGALPLLLLNTSLRSALGALFLWKLILTIVILTLAVFLYRVFCRYICPLGAFYGLLHPFSFYRFVVTSACTHCSACTRACKMNINPSVKPNSPECIRCGDCIRACPTEAIKSSFCKTNLSKKKAGGQESID